MLEFAGALSWQITGWFPTGMVQSLVTQNLVNYTQDGGLTLGLATSIEHPSSTTYIYHLKHGVRFSDGRPLTAADVIYSLDVNRAPNAVWKVYWENVASVTAHSNFAVAIELKRSTADWPSQLALSDAIIEKAAAERAGGEKTLGTTHNLPIGTGPWKFASYSPDIDVKLASNSYWAGQRQPATKITVNFFKDEGAMALALRSGAIDEAMDYTSQKLFASIPNVHQLGGAQGAFDYLTFNMATPPFNNVHVRRAIAYATDVNGMLKALYPTGGASRPASLAPNISFADLAIDQNRVNHALATVPQYGFDLAAAKSELAKSPYPHGFSATIQAGATEPVLVEAAQILSSDLTKIGIEAKVDEYPPNEFSAFYGSKVKLLLNELGVLYPQPDVLPEELLSSSNIKPPGDGDDWASYRNSEVNRLLSEQQRAESPPKRLQLIAKILEIAGNELPYLPMFQHSLFADLSSNYVDPSWSYYTAILTPWALSVKLAS